MSNTAPLVFSYDSIVYDSLDKLTRSSSFLNDYKKALIVVPHPDDLEILVGHFTQYLISKKFQIIELLMTGGEYGIHSRFQDKSNKLKGRLLQRIRKIENWKAKIQYGQLDERTPAVLSLRANYVDGYLPLNLKSVDFVIQTILKIQPSIVVAPDPIYSIDWHKDHMNTAYNVLFALRKLVKKKETLPFLKLYLLFQTYRPNVFFKTQSWNMTRATFAKHKSQLTPLQIRFMISFMKNLFYPLRKNYVGLRKIDLSALKGHKPLAKTVGSIKTLKDWILYSLLCNYNPDDTTYLPTPKELGLTLRV